MTQWGEKNYEREFLSLYSFCFNTYTNHIYYGRMFYEYFVKKNATLKLV